MNRRELFQLGAAVAFPMPSAAAQAALAAPGWQPRFFDAHQNATVVALSELIIPATETPGARAANVNRYLDLILADGPEAMRSQFLEGVYWLDSHSHRRHGKPFVSCSASGQTAILKDLDESKDPAMAPGNRFFRFAKSMTARIYYATEIGFRELNKGRRVPASYGCEHAEH